VPSLGRGSTATQLRAVVGPGKTISLRRSSGAKVTALRAGTYTIVVRDRSRSMNFRLSGPDPLFGKKTTLHFVGTVTWRVHLVRGVWRYDCASHPRAMAGHFRVT